MGQSPEETRTVLAVQEGPLMSDAASAEIPAQAAIATETIEVSRSAAKALVTEADQATIGGEGALSRIATPFDPIVSEYDPALTAPTPRPIRAAAPFPALPSGQKGTKGKPRAGYLRWFRFSRAEF
jgi:hypothetical protein